jgi:hypothetical protein
MFGDGLLAVAVLSLFGNCLPACSRLAGAALDEFRRTQPIISQVYSCAYCFRQQFSHAENSILQTVEKSSELSFALGKRRSYFVLVTIEICAG